jgi:hypothetical protein
MRSLGARFVDGALRRRARLGDVRIDPGRRLHHVDAGVVARGRRKLAQSGQSLQGVGWFEVDLR